MFDLVVRNGLVADGTGLPPFRADVAVRDGRVVQVGPLPAAVAGTEIDAAGAVVAPGFVDIHTHFDAQLSWDPHASPALEHGVTTVVTGNCSLSLAPLRAEQRARLSRMFGQIEQMPLALFEDGVDWSWETFGEWVAARRGRLGLNLAPLVGHSVLRMFAMGDAAHERAATDDEIMAMQRELAAALDAGAAGLSLSYCDVDEKGQPVPSRFATTDEIDRLAATLGEYQGMLQIVPEFWDADLICQRVDELARRSLDWGIATTFSPLLEQSPGHAAKVLTHLDRWLERGARVYPQVQPRGFDVNFRLCEWNFVLYKSSGWSRILKAPDRAEQIAAYRDRATRDRLIATAYPDDNPAQRAQLDTAYVSASGDASLIGRTLSDVARERGVTPAEVMIDIALADGLETRFTKPPTTDEGAVQSMLAHPAVLIGASDAGAHVRAFSTYGDTAVVFERFVRERAAMRLEEAIKRLTSDLAVAWNLPQRGQLRPGYAADIVVFDPHAIGRGPEHDLADMPAGCARYVRGSVGVAATVVNGQLAWTRDGGYTPSLAGTIAT